MGAQWARRLDTTNTFTARRWDGTEPLFVTSPATDPDCFEVLLVTIVKDAIFWTADGETKTCSSGSGRPCAWRGRSVSSPSSTPPWPPASSYSKVRAMTRVGNENNQELLLTFAKSSTGAQLETICRGYRQVARHEEGARRRTDDDERFVRRRALPNGMVRLEAQLYPDEAERVFRALHETRLALSAPTPANERTALTHDATSSLPPLACGGSQP